MSKKICMFVWNHFTNDARVLREAIALTEAGYEVDVVAVHDPKNPHLSRKETLNGFNVIRVKRYPNIYIKIQELKRKVFKTKKIVKNKKMLVLLMIPAAILLFPLFLVYKLIYLFLKKTKFLKTYIRFCIFLRMIKEGLRKDYDIYHSNDLNTLPQGYICKLIKKSKLIYDSHEVQTSRTGYVGKQYYYLEKFLIKKIDKMIMTTDTRAEYTAKLYGIEKPEVVHNYPFYRVPQKHSVDLYKLLDITKEEPILLYQGGIQQGRGLEKIVEAIPKIKKGVIVFIGDGKIKNEIIKLCEEIGVMDRVRFVPKVPVNELLNYTQNAYLGFQVLQNICYNHYSTLSNKLFEYIMAEVPVVASSFPEIKKVVEGERVGVTIDPHESENIAKAVNFMIDNPDKYAEYKANCKKAREKYNWEREKENFIRIYREVI
ncbi:glycosyltransferase [Caloranaerobacter ferrireducens]|uniref:glycosyltransferase n=1 Tax=Caloranaerobacter ferrireducens TaxID=1323370 RepID=UPI000B01DF59|nr:glycosyltransferase [Caloranaerobacter ferrireducens]